MLEKCDLLNTNTLSVFIILDLNIKFSYISPVLIHLQQSYQNRKLNMVFQILFYSVRNYKKIIITSNYNFKCATSTPENCKISTKSDYSCETSSHVNGWSICTEVALCQWGTKPCIKLFVGWGLITHAYDFYNSQELECLMHSIRWSNILKYSVNKFACLKWFWQFQQKRYSKTEFISNIKIGCIMCCPVMTSALSLRVLQKRISH